jgi:hypothetical protein
MPKFLLPNPDYFCQPNRRSWHGQPATQEGTFRREPGTGSTDLVFKNFLRRLWSQADLRGYA